LENIKNKIVVIKLQSYDTRAWRAALHKTTIQLETWSKEAFLLAHQGA